MQKSRHPANEQQMAEIYQARQARSDHPEGLFDNGGRWYPSDYERASCCASVAGPSRAHPYGLMTHCRTGKHLRTWLTEKGEQEAKRQQLLSDIRSYAERTHRVALFEIMGEFDLGMEEAEEAMRDAGLRQIAEPYYP